MTTDAHQPGFPNFRVTRDPKMGTKCFSRVVQAVKEAYPTIPVKDLLQFPLSTLTVTLFDGFL